MLGLKLSDVSQMAPNDFAARILVIILKKRFHYGAFSVVCFILPYFI